MDIELIILVGIHTSGKTTLGEFFRSKGYSFWKENPIKELKITSPLNFQPEVEKGIILNEIQRDNMILKSKLPLVIETWHIGNFAYAITRNRNIALEYKSLLLDQIYKYSILCVVLDLPFKSIVSRSAYYKNVDLKILQFYKDVYMNLISFVNELNCPHIKINAFGSVEDIYCEILNELKKYNG